MTASFSTESPQSPLFRSKREGNADVDTYCLKEEQIHRMLVSKLTDITMWK